MQTETQFQCVVHLMINGPKWWLCGSRSLALPFAPYDGLSFVPSAPGDRRDVWTIKGVLWDETKETFAFLVILDSRKSMSEAMADYPGDEWTWITSEQAGGRDSLEAGRRLPALGEPVHQSTTQAIHQFLARVIGIFGRVRPLSGPLRPAIPAEGPDQVAAAGMDE
jgi:hypothetical protein